MAQGPDPSRRELARQRLTLVFTTTDEIEANMVQELLRSAGIESMINAKISPYIYPFSLGPLAKKDILVLESDAAEAARMIAERQSAFESLEAEIPEDEP